MDSILNGVGYIPMDYADNSLDRYPNSFNELSWSWTIMYLVIIVLVLFIFWLFIRVKSNFGAYCPNMISDVMRERYRRVTYWTERQVENQKEAERLLNAPTHYVVQIGEYGRLWFIVQYDGKKEITVTVLNAEHIWAADPERTIETRTFVEVQLLPGKKKQKTEEAVGLKPKYHEILIFNCKLKKLHEQTLRLQVVDCTEKKDQTTIGVAHFAFDQYVAVGHITEASKIYKDLKHPNDDSVLSIRLKLKLVNENELLVTIDTIRYEYSGKNPRVQFKVSIIRGGQLATSKLGETICLNSHALASYKNNFVFDVHGLYADLNRKLINILIEAIDNDLYSNYVIGKLILGPSGLVDINLALQLPFDWYQLD
ncbi:hypothetical protein SNEBB_005954 [Seison nebaliae]|nr:hypothetical protein SNEBB_005954 [Seison nebaliae]